MTDSHVFAVVQYLLDHVEWAPTAWRAFLALLGGSALVTMTSAWYRGRPVPRLARLVLAFEPAVLTVWRLVAAFFARLAGAPADLISRSAIESAQKRTA